MFTAQALVDLCQQLNIPLPDRDFPIRATLHLEEVYRWNKVHDLTAVHHKDAMLRHTVDCLLPFVGVTPPPSLLDIGSGAGFPGVVLALYWPNTRVTLCEPLRKRRSFLDTVCARVGLNSELLATPVEDISHRSWDMVTSRATLPWPQLLTAALPVTSPGGQLMALCGPEQAPSTTDLVTIPAWENAQRRDYQLPDGARRCLISAMKSAT